MSLYNSIQSIYYNTLSIFYIVLNIVFPFYSEDILRLQYRIIENINDSMVNESNSRKRKRFDLFVENLVQKNNELIEIIKKIEEENDNISNYEKFNIGEEDEEDEDEEDENEDEEDEDEEDEDEEDEDNQDVQDNEDEEVEDKTSEQMSSVDETIFEIEIGEKKNN